MKEEVWDGDVQGLIKDLESGHHLYLTPAMGAELATMLRSALRPEGAEVAPEEQAMPLLRRALVEMRRWKSCQNIGACRNCADDGFILQLGLFLELHKPLPQEQTTPSDGGITQAQVQMARVSAIEECRGLCQIDNSRGETCLDALLEQARPLPQSDSSPQSQEPK